MQEKVASLSWDDKTKICKQWQLSGLSMTKFCEQQKLALATFSGWCNRLWPSRRESKLCPVEVTQSHNSKQSNNNSGTNNSIVIALELSNKVTARIEATINNLGFILQELQNATTTIR
jgi:hypothetical protein